MNGFFEALPWNLSALAALVVLGCGIISGVDPWVALERGCIGFAIFWIVGAAGRKIFSSSTSHSESSVKPAHTVARDAKHVE